MIQIGPAASRRLCVGVVASAVTVWVVVLARHAAYRHGIYLSNAFDMGVIVQGLWLVRSGHAAFSTVTGLSLLGDHARLIMFPLAYVVPTNVALLLTLQATGLASGAIAVYVLARSGSIAKPWLPTAAAVLFLMSPPLQWITLYDFHPEVLAGPLLLWAFVAATRQRWLVFWVLVAIALLCREDVGVAVAILGAAVLIDLGNRRVGVVAIASGATWWIVAERIIGGHNPYGVSAFAQRYEWIGSHPASAAVHLVTRFPHWLFSPVPVLAALVVMVFAVFGSMPFALLAPRRIVWLPLPLLLANAFANSPTQQSVYFHYTYLAYPFLAICLVRGFEALDRWPRRGMQLAAFAAGTGLVVVTVASFSPFTDVRPPVGSYIAAHTYPRPAALRRQFQFTHPRGYVAEARAALALVNDDQGVSASGNLVSHLADRQHAYMFPNPFYPVWFGRYLFEDAAAGMSATMPRDPPRWVLRDSAHAEPEPAPVAAELQSLLQSRYDRIFQGAFISVWRLRG
jgi:uncharacterized membrane protein